jgi:hypothetical protein
VERDALTARSSLYDHALRLHRARPDGRLPRRGYPLPKRPDAPPPPPCELNWSDARDAVAAILTPLVARRDADNDTTAAADEIHRALDALGVQGRAVDAAVEELPLPDAAVARALGRHLTRTGTGGPAVRVGLGLLARCGEQEDVPYLKLLGLLSGLARPAVHALTALDCPTAALVWLADRVRAGEVRHLVEALLARDDPAARACLLALPVDRREVGPDTARRIAEAVRLADVLVQGPGTDPPDEEAAVLLQAGLLLATMTSARDYRAEILAYADAVAVYDALVSRADRMPPTLDGCAILLSLALDLHSGPSVLLDWRPGQREGLLDALAAELAAPARVVAVPAEPTDPLQRRRADWIRRTARGLFADPAAAAESPGGRLRVEVAVRDPADPDTVETRLLIDGRPLVAEAFGHGPANSPEYLLDAGRLRAAPEPREVQLAEAYCTEGCCGALYVTICRDRDDVVWRDWRRPQMPRSRPPRPELPAYRFDAAAYDAEIARAETDRSWAWPARETARLITAGLRERPGIMTQWDARGGWAGTEFGDPDTIALSFVFWPGLAAGRQDRDGPWLQFVWRLAKDARTPEEQAAAALRRLSAKDPKSYAKVCGGSREDAETLGYPWPEPG